MPSKKQNIAAIADQCKVARWRHSTTHYTVIYRGFFAPYDLSGGRPKFIVGMVREPDLATNQFIIDGMRLAAQRVIDKRKAKPKRSPWQSALDDMITRGVGVVHVDLAKPGSDISAMFIQQVGRGMRPGYTQADPISAAVARMATMTYSELAREYQTAHAEFVKHHPGDRMLSALLYEDDGKKAKREQAKKLMDLADDIACARFGVGFYAPGK